MSYNRLPLLIREEIETIGSRFSKKHLLGLVDYYDYSYEEGRAAQKWTGPQKNNLQVVQHIAGPKLRDWQRRAKMLTLLNEDTRQALQKVASLINCSYQSIIIAKEARNGQDVEARLDGLFQLYYSLPRERFLMLGPTYRQKLLGLAQYTPKRTEQTTLRFLSILNDMITAGVFIPTEVYNHAIHLVGRTMGNVSNGEVESALRRWISMEASMSGNTTTFNILFDIAVKGQQFALAEMILGEMNQRGIQQDRFTRVGLIYYHGIRGDGDAIRKAYRELVKKDFIIDTTVLNCVIASLLRAGEAEAAQHVYQRMKENHSTEGTGLERHGQYAKASAHALQNIVLRLHARDDRLIRQLQREQVISPDRKTFSILVSHHVSIIGDFERISAYLTEMENLGITPHGRIFMELFRGFWNHGGQSFTLWTRTTLDEVYKSFQDLAKQDTDGSLYWDKWVVLWILRAFVKCYGRSVAIEKWEMIRIDWKAAMDHEIFMLEVIDAAEKSSRKSSEHRRIDA